MKNKQLLTGWAMEAAAITLFFCADWRIGLGYLFVLAGEFFHSL